MSNNTRKDYAYTVVVFQTDPFNATIPDLTIFVSASTRDEILSRAKTLAQKEVESLVSHGKPVPIPSSLDRLRSRWSGENIEFLTVTVNL